MNLFSDGGSTPPASTIPFHVMCKIIKKCHLVKLYWPGGSFICGNYVSRKTINSPFPQTYLPLHCSISHKQGYQNYLHCPFSHEVYGKKLSFNWSLSLSARYTLPLCLKASQLAFRYKTVLLLHKRKSSHTMQEVLFLHMRNQ